MASVATTTVFYIIFAAFFMSAPYPRGRGVLPGLCSGESDALGLRVVFTVISMVLEFV